MESRLGRYQVLKHLTSGGMADVLLGRAEGIEGFERHVVLKRIRPEHARDQRFIRMFLDEARVAASLHHQHIVQVHDIGESEGDYFIAMEYLHGEDVRSILSKAAKSRAHVPLGYAIAIVSAAAAGLHYAHERRGADKRPLGIVHRDISPSNILVGYDGSIKIVDFGIAKASMRQETRWSTLKGKVSYMSPEQCKGVEVDRRSDVYSLGVVLYELCTTTRVFKGESDYLVMDQIVNGRVTLPQVRRPDLPNDLSAIIMRALAADPERRYFTADELRLALDRFAANAGLTASTSGIAAYIRKQFGERPEPWLELEDQSDSFDDVPVSVAGTAPSNSWSELPPSDEYTRRSTGSIPRQSGSIPLPGATAPDVTATARRAQTVIPQSTQPITASKMGWESQPPAQAHRALTPAKIAMIGAPLIAILGVVIIWQLTGSSSGPSSASAAVVTALPLPTLPPAPPPPEPQPAAAAVSVEPIDQTPAITMRTPEPAPTRKLPAASTTKKTQKVADSVSVTMPPPGAKIETQSSPPPASPPPVVAQPTAPPQQNPPPLAVATQPTTSPNAALALPAAAPPLAMPAQNVAPTALDANRIAGERDIVPDNLTQSEIGRAGMDKVVSLYKVCIASDGAITTLTQIKGTGFPAYDSKIQNTIRGKWRYRPFIVNGKAVPVCTAVRFIYSQK